MISFTKAYVKWKKLANSIKLRLALNLSDVDPVTAKAAARSQLLHL